MAKNLVTVDEEHFRYEEVIRYVRELIQSGTLTPGSKAPSLRRLSKARGVSVTTALQAYRILESQGELEARPQSGFYVREQQPSTARPTMMRSSGKERMIKSGKKVSLMFSHAIDSTLVPLGCAIPSPDLLVGSQLDKFLVRVARTEGAKANTYASPQGIEELRDAIARRSMLWGHRCAPDDVLITAGCTEALHLALRVTTQPGDTVAVESPNYFGFLPILREQGLKVMEIPTDSVDGLSLEVLEQALDSVRVKVCLFSSAFNNPLGCLTPESKKSAVLKLLNRYRATLIEDDIYGDIYFGAERPRPYSAMDEARDVIYCSSFSKTVAPGYRIGWVSSEKHLDRLLESRYGTTLCSPILPQLAIARFLNGGAYDNHLRRLRSQLQKNIVAVSKVVTDTFPEGTRISRPEGGFVLWVELPKTIRTRELFETALEAGIAFAPGDLFTTTENYRSCLRLSCGYPCDSSLERGLWQLGALANQAL
ncbi:MAG: PLP-dependent aminotransferase family protein [Gammaproteobacteria bacterium]|nr:PLP-dependent aminotransferase family protein [Gammaproteobacteria bacterium]